MRGEEGRRKAGEGNEGKGGNIAFQYLSALSPDRVERIQ